MWWWLQGKKAKPDNGVEQTLNGGIPWERSILDVLVASVVLLDTHPQHNHGDQHHPQHNQDNEMLDTSQSVTQVSTSGKVPARASLRPTW